MSAIDVDALINVQVDFTVLATLLKDLDARTKAQESIIADLVEKDTKRQSLLATLQGQLNQTLQANNVYEEDIAKLKQQVEAANGSIVELKSSQKDANSTIEKLGTQVHAAIDSTHANAQSIEQNNSDIASLQEKLAKLQAQHDDLRSTVTAAPVVQATEDDSVEREQQAALNAQALQQIKRNEDAIRDLSDTCADIKTIEKLRSDVSSNEQEIALNKENIAGLRRQVGAMSEIQMELPTTSSSSSSSGGNGEGGMVDDKRLTQLEQFCTRKFKVLEGEDQYNSGRIGTLESKLGNVVSREAVAKEERGSLDERLTLVEGRAVAVVASTETPAPEPAPSFDLIAVQRTVDSYLEKSYEELRTAVQELYPAAPDQSDQDASFEDKMTAFTQDMLARMAQVRRDTERKTKVELKKFEQDIMQFLDELRTSGGMSMNEAAVGKIHFRCLSCDQVIQSQHGPASVGFQQAIALGDHSMHPKHVIRQLNEPVMAIERGEEVQLVGQDGNMYRGRNASTIKFQAPRPSSSSKFTVDYTDKEFGNRTRPVTAANASVSSGKSLAFKNRPRSAKITKQEQQMLGHRSPVQASADKAPRSRTRGSEYEKPIISSKRNLF